MYDESDLFYDFANKQKSEQERRADHERELKFLLGEYLGREGVKLQVLKAEEERRKLGSKHFKELEEMHSLNQQCKFALDYRLQLWRPKVMLGRCGCTMSFKACPSLIAKTLKTSQTILAGGIRNKMTRTRKWNALYTSMKTSQAEKLLRVLLCASSMLTWPSSTPELIKKFNNGVNQVANLLN